MTRWWSTEGVDSKLWVLLALCVLSAAGCEEAPELARAAAELADAPPPIPALALPQADSSLFSPSSELDSATPTVDTATARAPEADFPNARFPRPDAVKGIYVNGWAAGSRSRMGRMIEIARETEVNALVIDIKDATGFISHKTEVELAHAVGATEELRILDLPGLLDRLEEEGIYPIARIVIVKDPILTTYRPEFAIQDTAGGVWVDSKGITWLNPYNEEVWRYHVDLAREVAKMGFPEIQWDYVRFPDAPQADMDRAVFDHRDGRSKAEAIRGFLRYARSNLADLPVRTTADVFGVTTTYRRDVGTGQIWEELIDVVDVALPMVYPSHYWPGSYGHEEPNARPYEVVRRALEDARQRSAQVPGAGLTRPWLQDFTLGQPVYAAAEVRAQIQATYDAGVREWILWNPGSSYTVAALEPVGGFDWEPLVRVAGVLAPVSRRLVVIDSVAAAERRAASEREAEGSAVEAEVADPPTRVGNGSDTLPICEDAGPAEEPATVESADDGEAAEADRVGATTDATEVDAAAPDPVAGVDQPPPADSTAVDAEGAPGEDAVGEAAPRSDPATCAQGAPAP